MTIVDVPDVPADRVVTTEVTGVDSLDYWFSSFGPLRWGPYWDRRRHFQARKHRAFRRLTKRLFREGRLLWDTPVTDGRVYMLDVTSLALGWRDLKPRL